MPFIADTAVVDARADIGDGTNIWHHSQVREGAKIGRSCNIGKGVYIDTGVLIGDRVKVQNCVSIYKGVEISDDVFIGPSVTFTNDKHPRAWLWDEERLCRTKVGKGASIGANSTVLCGIEIGEYAMVGAGSVVTKSVLPHSLVVGNPARPVAFVCECGEKLDRDMRCPSCGKEYPELRE